jgi:hypothetical protein
LKKQSQFAVGHINAKSVLTKVYENHRDWRQQGDKANQSQFQNATTAFGAHHTRDCRSPSGRATIFFGGFLQSVTCRKRKIIRSSSFINRNKLKFLSFYCKNSLTGPADSLNCWFFGSR